MKSDLIFLCKWSCDSTDNLNDIPWPMIHKWTGCELIKWINQQKHIDCQLLIEKSPQADDGFIRLCAEFYNPKLRSEFALRFAK